MFLIVSVIILSYANTSPSETFDIGIPDFDKNTKSLVIGDDIFFVRYVLIYVNLSLDLSI